MSIAKCGGATRTTGRPCARPAGWGTDHLGFGSCKLHGGATRTGRTHGLRLAAEHAVVTYGLAREVDPHEALLEELYRTAGHVAWLGDLIAAMERGELKQYAGTEDGYLWEKPAVWLELYHRERRHYVAIAKTCVDVGIEERRVHLAEQQAQLLADVIRGILLDHGIAPEAPETRRIVRRHLELAIAHDTTPGMHAGAPTDPRRVP